MSLDPIVSITKKVYVDYDLPGTIMAESYVKQIDVRSIDAAIADAPSRAFSFRFYEVYEGSFEIDGQKITMTSEPLKRSGRHFIDGAVLDEDSLAKEGISGYEPGRVVKTRLGNRTWFDDKSDLIVHS